MRSALGLGLDIVNQPTKGTLDALVTSSMHAYWRLDSRLDYSGNGRHLSAVPSDALIYGPAKLGNGAIGRNSAITGSIVVSRPFTLSCWIKPHTGGNSDNATRMRISFGANNVGIYVVYTGGLQLAIAANGVFGTKVAVSADVWHHCVMAYTATDKKLYIDNVLVATDAGTLSTTYTTITVDPVASPNTAELDDVGLWTKELSTDEIARLYNSGNGFDPTLP